MFVRVVQVLGLTLYIFAAIGGVSYMAWSLFWLVPLHAPAIYIIFNLPEVSGPPIPVSSLPADWRKDIEIRIEELKNGPSHRNKVQYIDNVSRGIPYSDDRIDCRRRRQNALC